MCGIVGYTGEQTALPHLLSGLSALEYRGYDSAGVALTSPAGLDVVRRAGRLAVLEQALAGGSHSATTGVGHTRWATHGGPEDRNAHPHTDMAGALAVVHNGIIENHRELRAQLEACGCRLVSETDTEVIAHLLAAEAGEGTDDPEAVARALSRVLRRVKGAFALGIVFRDLPGVVLSARRGAPLLIGRAPGATLLASDVAGLAGATDDVEALDDDQIALLTPEGASVRSLDGTPAHGRRFTVDWEVDRGSRGAYPHYMLKEIHEQPAALRRTLDDRLGADGRLRLDVTPVGGLGGVDGVLVLGCGSSTYAGMAAQPAIEHWAGVPVTVEVASEFRYREPVLSPRTLVVAISQSGETADTIAAAAHAQRLGARVLALTNTIGSTITRDADMVLYTHAGAEVGVAATKTFTCQVAALDLIGLWLAQELGRHPVPHLRRQLDELGATADLVAQALLDLQPEVERIAEQLVGSTYVMLIGRHLDLPLALEGALKLKEVSYVTAEGYPAGEMKHGPIALIERDVPVIALATSAVTRDKVVSNIAEVRARGAKVIAIAADGDVDLKAHADRVLHVPATAPLWSPLLTVLPLQLLSYHLAVALGRDVDMPRNLAKTVTVE